MCIRDSRRTSYKILFSYPFEKHSKPPFYAGSARLDFSVYRAPEKNGFVPRLSDDAPYAVRRSGDVRDEFILPHPGNAFNTDVYKRQAEILRICFAESGATSART